MPTTKSKVAKKTKKTKKRKARRSASPSPVLPSLNREPIQPMLGEDLDILRSRLSGNQRPITTQDLMHELGLQRTRYTQVRKLNTLPILKPRIEILARALEEWPHLSFVQEEFLPVTILKLMDKARPPRVHTMRDLSILLGYEMSAHLPWIKGKKMLPTPKRIMRMLYLGLTQPKDADCSRFLNEFEQLVVALAAGHGISHADLAKKGFSGYRKYRQATWADAGTGEDGAD